MHMKISIQTYDSDMAGRPTNKPAPAFGGCLAALRKSHGLTQPKMAEMLGISPAMLAYYERKATNPTSEFIQKAAAVLNVSVDQLLGHEVKDVRKHGPPSDLEQRLSAVRQLPRDKQKMVLHFLDAFLRDAQTGKAS
jgi:transcriptional regulator with XRE-family HTH domain